MSRFLLSCARSSPIKRFDRGLLNLRLWNSRSSMPADLRSHYLVPHRNWTFWGRSSKFTISHPRLGNCKRQLYQFFLVSKEQHQLSRVYLSQPSRILHFDLQHHPSNIEIDWQFYRSHSLNHLSSAQVSRTRRRIEYMVFTVVPFQTILSHFARRHLCICWVVLDLWH